MLKFNTINNCGLFSLLDLLFYFVSVYCYCHCLCASYFQLGDQVENGPQDFSL